MCAVSGFGAWCGVCPFYPAPEAGGPIARLWRVRGPEQEGLVSTAPQAHSVVGRQARASGLSEIRAWRCPSPLEQGPWFCLGSGDNLCVGVAEELGEPWSRRHVLERGVLWAEFGESRGRGVEMCAGRPVPGAGTQLEEKSVHSAGQASARGARRSPCWVGCLAGPGARWPARQREGGQLPRCEPGWLS